MVCLRQCSIGGYHIPKLIAASAIRTVQDHIGTFSDSDFRFRGAITRPRGGRRPLKGPGPARNNRPFKLYNTSAEARRDLGKKKHYIGYRLVDTELR